MSARAYARCLRAELIYLSYRIRPYDMLADRRRWAWQRRTPCGLGGLTPEARAQLVTAAVAYLRRRKP